MAKTTAEEETKHKTCIWRGSTEGEREREKGMRGRSDGWNGRRRRRRERAPRSSGGKGQDGKEKWNYRGGLTGRVREGE